MALPDNPSKTQPTELLPQASASTPPPESPGAQSFVQASESARPPASGSSRRAPMGGRPTFAAADVIAGRYKVVRFVAAGAMGEVYEVEDLVLRGHVALKTIRPEIAADARATERFKREIHVARKVTHPNVCRIYDLGTHRAQSPDGAAGEEVLFLTMELLTGDTLSERIARNERLTTAEALPIVSQIAAGLEAAHAVGIIHRDFKSGNVVLVPDPHGGSRAVVTDFGLARTTASSESLASISDTGVVVGTPAYMAPEQVQGLELTPAADTYALGIVMYEMVTGLRPFDGGSAITVAVKRLTEAPRPPRDYVSDLEPAWEAAILRCLERDPAARFQKPTDVVGMLSGQVKPPSRPISTAATASVLMPSTAGTRLRHRRLREIAAASGLVVAVVMGYAIWRARRPAPATTPSAAVASVAPRRAVAVLGFKNVSGRADAAWLSTAIAEMLTTDLAAGGSLRTISGQEVARAKTELGVAEIANLTKEVSQRIGRNLATDLIVFGSYTAVGGGESRLVRIELRLQDAANGEQIVSGTANGTEAQLFDLVSRAGKPLRAKLGLTDISPAEALEVEGSLPTQREAAKLYAEGLDKLRVSDALAARDVLEQAVAAEPKHPLPHEALAAALSVLGYEGKAREEAKKAAALSASLPREQKLSVEARFYETSKDWDKAIESYRSLFGLFPDNLEYGLRFAEAQVWGGRTKEALVTLAALRKLPPSISEDPRIDLVQALACREQGDFKQQQSLAAQAARKGSALGARLVVARARLLEATALDFQGGREPAMGAIQEATKLYEAAGDKSGLARALNQMAVVVRNGGDLDGERRLYEKALAIHRELGEKSSVARVLFNMGVVLYDQGNLSEAQKRFEESLATFRQIGARYETAVALNDIGAKLQNSGDLAGAQKRYQEALGVFGEIGDKRGVAMSLTNLAEVQYARGDLKQAQEMHEESLAINRETGDKSGEAYDLYRLGEVFAARGDLKVAAAKYEEALGLQKQLADQIAMAQTRLGLAALAVAEGRAADGEALAREAEEVARAGKAGDVEALADVMIAQALLAQGKTAEAWKASGVAQATSARSEDRGVRMAVAILAARARAASAKPEEIAAALQTLEKTGAEAARAGFVRQQYEARLAQGEIETASGRSAAGRARLSALATEARAKGFGLIARLAQRS